MKKLLMILLLCSMVGAVYAQYTLAEVAEKLENQSGHDELKGQGLVQHSYTFTKIPSKYYIEKAYQYKRVGILSIMVNQQMAGESTVVQGNAIRTFYLGNDELMALATSFSSEIEEGLKEAGAENGVEVLTPSEYLTSEELVNEYLNISLEKGKLVEAKMIESSLGYRSFPKLAYSAVPGMGGVSYASFYTIGTLAQKCGLDAMVMVVVSGYPTMSKKKTDKKFLFHRIEYHNLMVNQTPFDADKKYSKLLGGYAALNGGGKSMLVAGGAPIMEFSDTGEGKIVSSEWRPQTNGATRISSTREVTLNTKADYRQDLGQVASSFGKYYIEQVLDYVEKTNDKNKLIP